MVMPLTLVHPRTTYSPLNLSATIKNCSSQLESWTFSVYAEQDPTPIYTLSTGGAVQRPGDSLTVFIGSLGSVPGNPGATESFTGVLTRTGATPGLISSVTSSGGDPHHLRSLLEVSRAQGPAVLFSSVGGFLVRGAGASTPAAGSGRCSRSGSAGGSPGARARPPRTGRHR